MCQFNFYLYLLSQNLNPLKHTRKDKETANRFVVINRDEDIMYFYLASLL